MVDLADLTDLVVRVVRAIRHTSLTICLLFDIHIDDVDDHVVARLQTKAAATPQLIRMV